MGSMGSVSARSWDDDLQLSKKGGAGGPKQELRLLRRRNERLQTELQRSLNLYGQSVGWLNSERKVQEKRGQEEEQRREQDQAAFSL